MGRKRRLKWPKNKDNSDASKIIHDEEMLWRRKLDLAYGSDNQEEKTQTKKPATKSTSVAW
eukprot:4194522-Ditylum_brightwellii.AAC.1